MDHYENKGKLDVPKIAQCSGHLPFGLLTYCPFLFYDSPPASLVLNMHSEINLKDCIVTLQRRWMAF